MIPAAKNAFFGALFGWHVRRRLRSSFARITVVNGDETRAACQSGPVLFVANHSTWWDGLVVLHLSTHVLDVDAYALMDAKNLGRLPFFRRVGAFGVDLASAKDGARGIRYGAELLGRPGRVVWVFPQGEERSPFEPIVVRPGAAAIARLAAPYGVQVVAVGLRYVFAGDERAHLRVAFGRPASPLTASDAEAARQVRAMETALALADRVGDRGTLPPGARVLHEARPGALGKLAERLLGKITG